ncbi:MAG TPA: DEAD/DEAH box helicase [Chthoniobacterales bacterium]
MIPQTNFSAPFRPEDQLSLDHWIQAERKKHALPVRFAQTSAKTLLRYLRSACPLLSELPGLEGLKAEGLDIHGNTLWLRQRLVLESPPGVHVFLKTPLVPLDDQILGNYTQILEKLPNGLADARKRLKHALERGQAKLSPLQPSEYTPEEWQAICQELEGSSHEPQTLGAFASRVDQAFRLSCTLKQKRELAEGLKLLEYPETFARARSTGRRLTAILGPTNSGKTHQALTRLAVASTGVYLAPLRLLAAEVWDRLQSEGVYTDLITGEERIVTGMSTHVSSTVEMLDSNQPYDVAVIDEVQMLADPSRGWAWTQAIVGVNAREVVLLGSPEAGPVLERLAEALGEPLEVSFTARLKPLRVADRPLENPKDAPAGTAFVSFSRAHTLAWKKTLGEENTACIYGALSPEVRRGEARRFAEGRAAYLSSTDAISMGLNLPIRMIVFTGLTKWNGKAEVTLSNTEILQIAGRAGRFGHGEEDEAGVVTALNAADLETIRQALASGTGEALPLKVPVAPRLQTLEYLAERTGKDRLDSLLKTFSSLPERDQLFGKADITGMLELAAHPKARASGLPLRDLLVLCNCPITQKEPSHLGAWIGWVEALERGRSCPLPALESRLDGAADTPQDLHGAERDGRLLGAYKWMHYHFPEAFPDLAGANRELGRLNQYILASLQKRLQAVCHDCGRKLPTNWRSRQCRACTEVPPPVRGRPGARFHRNHRPSKGERKPELAGASRGGTFKR